MYIPNESPDCRKRGAGGATACSAVDKDLCGIYYTPAQEFQQAAKTTPTGEEEGRPGV